MATQSETVRLLDELVRLQALAIRRQAPSQAEAITELSSAGLGPTRIAELLGTTPGTVNVALARQAKRRKTAAP